MPATDGGDVRAVIVADHLNDRALRDLDLDPVEEPDEFLMPVPLMQQPMIAPADARQPGGASVAVAQV
jgi:hypothetical protein